MTQENIFSSLSRYGFRQEENYLTESFVYLLNLLLEKDPTAGGKMLSNLYGDNLDFIAVGKDVSISTQLTFDDGQPDIAIKVSSEKIILVEVKCDSPLGQDQLVRYYDYLQSLPYTKK